MLSDPVVLMQGALPGLRASEKRLHESGIDAEVIRPPKSAEGSAC